MNGAHGEAGSRPEAASGGIHRFVVFGDICGSGTLGMAEKELHRTAMYAAFDEAYASVGVEPGTFHQEDRGTASSPPCAPTCRRRSWSDGGSTPCTRASAPTTRAGAAWLRLRIGMNAGLVVQDRHGLVGRAVDLAARLCDSPTAKRIMDEAPEVDLLVVVSDWLYGNVVAEGGRYVEPDHYRRARIRSKETDEAAWFHVPRRAAPPLIGPEGRIRPRGSGCRGWVQEPALGRRGDGPTPRTGGGNRTYNVGGDLLDIHHNTIHGGFTGIRKDAGAGEAE